MMPGSLSNHRGFSLLASTLLLAVARSQKDAAAKDLSPLEGARSQLSRFGTLAASQRHRGENGADPTGGDLTRKFGIPAMAKTGHASAEPRAPEGMLGRAALLGVRNRDKGTWRDADLQSVREEAAALAEVRGDHSEDGSDLRRLQTCPEGSGLTVTSSWYPLMEGCMIEGDYVTGGEVEFFGDSGIILSYESTDGQYYWGAFHEVGTDEYVQVCGTSEVATLVHPSEATWTCLIDDGTDDGALVEATSSTFGVECGCDDTTTTASDTIPATTPTPVAAPTAPSGSGSCADGDSVSVSSSLEPNLVGCYVSTNAELNDQLVYSKTGEVTGGEVWVAAFPISDDIGAEVYWYMAFVPTVTSSSAGVEIEGFCISFEEAADAHPGDVTAWFCFLDSTSTTGDVTSTCGCSDEPATTPVPTPEPTPEPTAEVTPEPTTAPTPSTRGGISSSVASPAPSAFTAPDTMSPTSTTPLLDADPTPQPSASANSFTTGPVEGVIPITGDDDDDDAGAATPSPAEEVGPTPDPEATSCEEDESFQITSSALPATQGCFQIATETFSTPGTTIELWSVDGTVNTEQVLVGGLAEDASEDQSDTPYLVYFSSADDDAVAYYCQSEEDAVSVHPVDATWLCDLDGTSTYVSVAAEDFSLACGCSGTPAPAATGAGTVPASPTAAPPTTPSGDTSEGFGRSPSLSWILAVSAVATAVAIGV